eukprot:JP446411.1.p1 GENE.JP446411.1~~JP446411.1.p1  ORF type:complete len:330 (+),score=176.89 JP446411.1:42-1031(+)
MFATTAARAFHASAVNNFKVAVLGSAGGIGQPLSLLCKTSDKITDLYCYDVAPVNPGVAADLSHINSRTKVYSGTGPEELDRVLDGADVVVIPAGVPRKPGMTRDDLFNTNASIVQTLIEGVAKSAPKSKVLIIANPVNSTVPIAAEVLKKAGVYNPMNLMGVTTLDVCRANTFIAENQKRDVNNENVTVIGGHAGITILPLLSQIPGAKFSEDEIAKLTHRIQFGGDEVVQAKAGGGSATLSMAYAGFRFTDRLLDALAGKSGVVECTFTENSITPAKFFSTPTKLGKDGAEEALPFGKLSAYEQEMFDKMLPDLQAQINKGVQFANK